MEDLCIYVHDATMALASGSAAEAEQALASLSQCVAQKRANLKWDEASLKKLRMEREALKVMLDATSFGMHVIQRLREQESIVWAQ